MKPPSVLHVVVTGNFAGTERYVSDVASETAARGWRVSVVGGDPRRMPVELHHEIRWLPGATLPAALRSIARAGAHDVCHAHLTYAEAAGAATRRLHRGSLVSTRHFAAHRGASAAGRLLAPWLDRVIDRQVAISAFVNRSLERPADAVVLNGTRPVPLAWRAQSRRVLVLQRLEQEKDTACAIEAWRLAGPSMPGWSLRIVGVGAQESALRHRAAGLSEVEFGGYSADVEGEFARAGMLLATAPAEPLGLSVVEAMAAGVPVVATAAGGHLETIGQLPAAPSFRPGDAAGAAAALVQLGEDSSARAELSDAGRRLHAQELTLSRHVDRLLETYPMQAAYRSS